VPDAVAVGGLTGLTWPGLTRRSPTRAGGLLRQSARELGHRARDLIGELHVRVMTRALEQQDLRSELSGDPLRLCHRPCARW
jgi:hypothetical protein